MLTPARRLTTYLVEDHARLHGLLERATKGSAFDMKAFAAFRAGLLRHIGIEEKLLLPAARSARHGVPLDRVRELRIEHAAIASLLVPTPDAALCSELLTILVPHEAKEEGPVGVYAECERLLSDAESDALAARAEAAPPVRVAPHFDGVRIYRTAALALAAARRSRQRDKET